MHLSQCRPACANRSCTCVLSLIVSCLFCIPLLDIALFQKSYAIFKNTKEYIYSKFMINKYIFTLYIVYLLFLYFIIYLFIFKLNLLGWHWLIRPYRFQLYILMILDLYIALCARHLKSNHFPPPYILGLLPTPPPHLFPSGNHHITVSMSFSFISQILVKWYDS